MAKEILAYFVRNPQAADSLEGMARWRLMDEFIRRTVDETQSALCWLVAEGYLLKFVSPATDATFSLNLARIEAARQFLATDASQKDQQK
jgi:hypothetical protein